MCVSAYVHAQTRVCGRVYGFSRPPTRDTLAAARSSVLPGDVCVCLLLQNRRRIVKEIMSLVLPRDDISLVSTHVDEDVLYYSLYLFLQKQQIAYRHIPCLDACLLFQCLVVLKNFESTSLKVKVLPTARSRSKSTSSTARTFSPPLLLLSPQRKVEVYGA